jgi:hypothetical protein
MARSAAFRMVIAASFAAAAAGCDTRNTESFVASTTNAPVNQPLLVEYHIAQVWGEVTPLYRMRVEPNGSQTCEAIVDNFERWNGLSTVQEVSCDFRARATNGRWALFGAGAQVIEHVDHGSDRFRPNDVLTVGPSSNPRLTFSSPGFHPTTVDCALTDSLRASGFGLESHLETQDCGTIVLEQKALEDSTLGSNGGMPIWDAEIRASIESSNDFPTRLAFSGTVDAVTGRVRTDAACPLLAANGNPVAHFSDAFQGGKVVMGAQFNPTRLGGASAQWQLHLLGDYEFAVGDAQLTGTVHVRGQPSSTWTASAANQTVIGPTTDWIPLAFQIGGRSTRVDRAGSGFVGHCQSDLARVQSAHARPVAGALTAGQTAEIDLIFSQAVDVVGEPILRLETGAHDRAATYLRGSGSSTLTFLYRVAEGDTSARLDLFSSRALTLEGGLLSKAGRTDGGVDLRVPAPGAAGSLGANSALRIGAGS